MRVKAERLGDDASLVCESDGADANCQVDGAPRYSAEEGRGARRTVSPRKAELLARINRGRLHDGPLLPMPLPRGQPRPN